MATRFMKAKNSAYDFKNIKLFVPDNTGLENLLNVGISNRVLMKPSRMPIWDPMPNDRSIEKKRRLQKGAPGSFVKTSAITMKAKPVP